MISRENIGTWLSAISLTAASFASVGCGSQNDQFAQVEVPNLGVVVDLQCTDGAIDYSLKTLTITAKTAGTYEMGVLRSGDDYVKEIARQKFELEANQKSSPMIIPGTYNYATTTLIVASPDSEGLFEVITLGKQGLRFSSDLNPSQK